MRPEDGKRAHFRLGRVDPGDQVLRLRHDGNSRRRAKRPFDVDGGRQAVDGRDVGWPVGCPVGCPVGSVVGDPGNGALIHGSGY